ncbi:hypothetical protein IKG41_00165 [Candidatus Saccharibacteria bacterium]|nr:hypothetical protein [Candidatus Saccharibacteria bacterium]
MLKLIKSLLASLMLLFTFFISLTPTYAANNNSADVCSQSVPDSVKQAAGCENAPSAELGEVIRNIVLAVIGAAGIVSVIYIIIGGYSYMTSSGETQKLEKAKKTILYATIGLAICVLAFAIVNFVINNIINYTPN